MQKIDFSIDFDNAEINKVFKETLQSMQQARIREYLATIFMSHQSMQWHKDRGNKIEADAGLMTKQLNDIMTDIVMSDEIKEHAKKYIAASFKKHLEDACDEMMKHAARKIAFNQKVEKQCE